MPDPATRPLPPYTSIFGYGGLIPFAALTVALWAGPEPATAHVLARALLGYGAVILAFLGAVHWGVVLARETPQSATVLALGVVPALVGAATLAMPLQSALVTQMIAFGAVWLYEHRVLGAGVLGKSYLDLRRNLTLAVLGILLLALLGPIDRLAGVVA